MIQMAIWICNCEPTTDRRIFDYSQRLINGFSAIRWTVRRAVCNCDLLANWSICKFIRTVSFIHLWFCYSGLYYRLRSCCWMWSLSPLRRGKTTFVWHDTSFDSALDTAEHFITFWVFDCPSELSRIQYE